MEDQSGIALKNKPFMADCVEWSQESRLAICVKNGVHIVVTRTRSHVVIPSSTNTLVDTCYPWHAFYKRKV